MCGRTACALAPEDVVKACSFKDKKGKRRQPTWIDAPGGQQYTPAYNVAPGAFTPVLLSGKHLCSKPGFSSNWNETSDIVVMPMKWGLVPPWHQGDPNKVPYETNNCRAEGMLEKKTYKVPLMRGNRCVILAEGFFEWKSSKDGKQPYYFYFPQDQLNSSLVKREEKSEFQDVKTIKAEKVQNVEPVSEINRSRSPDFKDQDSDKVLHCAESQTNIPIKSECSPCIIKQEVAESSQADKDEKKMALHQTDSKTHIPTSNICSPCPVKQEVIEASQTDIDELKLRDDDGAEEITTPLQGPRLLTMAGVFDVWKSDENAFPLYSYSVITVASSKDMDWCHHRMPAILSSEEEVQNWLDFSSLPLSKAAQLIKPKVCLSHHAVSKQVNSSRYQAADTVKPVQIRQPISSPGSLLMQQWLKSGSPEKRKLQDSSVKSSQFPSAKKKKKETGGENFMLKWLKTGSPAKQLNKL